jgi:hypothetical protein
MKPLQNHRGQFLVETVLMMTVMVGLFVFATSQLRERKYMAKLIGGPWQKISGMIESGVWEEPAKAKTLHPNQINRSNSLDPEG